MLRVVFTGAPGGGKTTVLQALRQRGHVVMADSARAIIRARKAASLSPRPAPVAFAQAILRRDVEQHGEPAANAGPVFFERGVVDALGMLHELGGLSDGELQQMLVAYPYHPQVFLFPAWEAIHTADAERDQTFEEAMRVCEATRGWYQRCGYDVVQVPETGVAERCNFVLQALGCA